MHQNSVINANLCMKPGLLYILSVLILLVSLEACNKNASDEVQATTKSSNLDVVNASDVTFNVYQNGTRLVNSANIYSLNHSGYLTVSSGTQNFSVRQPVDVNTLRSDTLFSAPLSLDTTRHYSLFVSNRTGSFLIKDPEPDSINSIATSGKATIRFVNASSSFNGLSVSVNDSTKFTNVNYKSVGRYTGVLPLPVPASATSAPASTVKVYTAGSTTPIVTATINISSGAVYTLFTRNVNTATGSPTVGIALIQSTNR